MQHKDSLGTYTPFSNSWYYFRHLPFGWIYYNGIHEQSWEAVTLYQLFFPSEMLFINGQSLYNQEFNKIDRAIMPITPFQTDLGIEFISGKIMDQTISLPLRNHALYLFDQSL